MGRGTSTEREDKGTDLKNEDVRRENCRAKYGRVQKKGGGERTKSRPEGICKGERETPLRKTGKSQWLLSNSIRWGRWKGLRDEVEEKEGRGLALGNGYV